MFFPSVQLLPKQPTENEIKIGKQGIKNKIIEGLFYNFAEVRRMRTDRYQA